MRAQEPVDSIFASGTAVFKIRVGTGPSEQRMSVTITRDDRVEWTYDQPSWRPLGFGCGHGVAYVWSARAVVVLPSTDVADPNVFEVDEDLLFVFNTDAGWVLVCETSVRLIVGWQESSRVEVGDVIEHARWNAGQLLIEDARGATTPIGISGGKLTC